MSDYARTRGTALPMITPQATQAPQAPASLEAPEAPEAPAAGVDRRSFLSETARLAALSVLVTACGGNLGSIAGPQSYTLSKAITVNLADYPGLAKAVSAVRISGTNIPIALVNEGNHNYVAVSLICTHQGATVQWTGQIFICPNHGAEFASDGHWIGGQPTANLVTYPTTYNASADTVTISPRG